MPKKFLNVASFAGLLLFASLGYSQAMPTAVSHGALQVGGGWSYANPDYGQKKIQGATIFGDFDLSPHLGAEAEFHYIALITPTDLAENSIFVGPRFVLPRGRYSFYAKALFGIGDIAIQETQDNPQGGAGNYIAYGAGLGVDYRVLKHLVVRGDFEYQHWNYLTGLTPTVATIGAAYRFR
jgi:Outer membrane protein beta-barrel domain